MMCAQRREAAWENKCEELASRLRRKEAALAAVAARISALEAALVRGGRGERGRERCARALSGGHVGRGCCCATNVCVETSWEAHITHMTPPSHGLNRDLEDPLAKARGTTGVVGKYLPPADLALCDARQPTRTCSAARTKSLHSSKWATSATSPTAATRCATRALLLPSALDDVWMWEEWWGEEEGEAWRDEKNA